MTRTLRKRTLRPYGGNASVCGYGVECGLSVLGLGLSVATFVPTGGIVGAFAVSVAVHSVAFSCF